MPRRRSVESGRLNSTSCSTGEFTQFLPVFTAKFREDHIVTRLSPSYNGLTGEKTKDFRFVMRLDRNKCGKKLLDAIYAGDIGVDWK